MNTRVGFLTVVARPSVLVIVGCAIFLVSGCADMYGAYPVANRGMSQGCYGGGWQTSQSAPPISSVQSSRVMTGSGYSSGMTRLNSWNATQREREINAYLARRPEFKTAVSQSRANLKAQLVRWDSILAQRRDLVTRMGGTVAADRHYAQLAEGRARTQSRLDQLDASLVSAMLEDNAGAAARQMSWTAEKARELDLVARNAAAAEAAERERADAAFRNAIF